jgi:hypothetical protein
LQPAAKVSVASQSQLRLDLGERATSATKLARPLGAGILGVAHAEQDLARHRQFRPVGKNGFRVTATEVTVK